MNERAREYLAVRSALNQLFEERDPIGMYQDSDGPGPGEYDCLTDVSLAGLQAGADASGLRWILESELAGHFGLPGQAVPPELIMRTESCWLSADLVTSTSPDGQSAWLEATQVVGS